MTTVMPLKLWVMEEEEEEELLPSQPSSCLITRTCYKWTFVVASCLVYRVAWPLNTVIVTGMVPVSFPIHLLSVQPRILVPLTAAVIPLDLGAVSVPLPGWDPTVIYCHPVWTVASMEPVKWKERKERKERRQLAVVTVPWVGPQPIVMSLSVMIAYMASVCCLDNVFVPLAM